MLFDGSHFISGTASRIISKLVLLPAIALLGAGIGAVTTYNYVINNYDQDVVIQEFNVNIYDSSNADAIVDGLLKYNPETIDVMVQNYIHNDGKDVADKRDKEGDLADLDEIFPKLKKWMEDGKSYESKNYQNMTPGRKRMFDGKIRQTVEDYVLNLQKRSRAEKNQRFTEEQRNRTKRLQAKDDVEAYAWFNVAVAIGQKKAAELRETINKNMTPEQIAEGQKRSREIMKTITEE